ncbi:MAG TPA: hypothetical protein VMI31_04245 [Fimbriimonadaceae bacterium]|nr:hypothetical protein [Fimbriimonadaceae bacterium]
MNGHPAGYATLGQTIQKDGSKSVELRLELGTGAQKVHITSQSRYDAQGNPIRKFQETVAPAGGINKQVVITFGKEGANVIVLDGDHRTSKSVSLASAAPRASLSEFWFLRDSPKPGQTEETYQFSADSLQWEIVKTEYRGKKTIDAGGHKIEAYETVTTRGDQETTSYLDEHGLPVLIDQGSVKMEKIWPK